MFICERCISLHSIYVTSHLMGYGVGYNGLRQHLLVGVRQIKRTRSSLKSRSSNCEHIVHYMPFLSLANISCIIQSIASNNREGESKQPCQFSVNTLKVSLVLPSCIIMLDMSL